MLLRAKKLSLDSDSLMKSLQGKYEQQEPKPPPVLGLGVRRYKGSKSALGRDRVPSLDSGTEELDHNMNIKTTDKTRKKSLMAADPSLDKIKEETDGKDWESEDVFSESVINEEELLVEVEQKMQEIQEEADRVLQSLEEDDLELTDDGVPVNGMTSTFDAAANGDIPALKKLILKGGDLNSADQDGSTPIEAACGNGHALAVRLLAKNGRYLLWADRKYSSYLYNHLFQ